MLLSKEKEEGKKKKELPNNIRLFLLALPAIYILLATIFLNKIPISNLFPMVESVSEEYSFIYFSNDIFDIFWLILAAIPNGVFAVAFLTKLDHIPKRILIAICISVFIFVAFIFPEICDFSSYENVWSHDLPRLPATIYNLFSFISVFILAAEALCVLCSFKSCNQEVNDSKSTGKNNLLLYPLAASIIHFFYWIMLILSDISNMKHSMGTVGHGQLIPIEYSVLGLVVTIEVTACIYHIWKPHRLSDDQGSQNSQGAQDPQGPQETKEIHEAQETHEPKETQASQVPQESQKRQGSQAPKRCQTDLGFKFVVGSIIIPCVPIIIQILQILL